MAIPKFEDFLFPFMMHLTNQDSNKSDMVSVLSDFFNLSEEDKQQKTKGGTSYQIYDRIGWSLQWLRRAKFVEIPEKGIWRITQRGRDFMRNATDLRESDLLKYPEFAEYSGRRNERKRQRLSPSATTTSAIVTHNENWKEIVEVLRSAIEEASSFLLYVNSVISCLRLLGWKKSNGTIQIESNNRVDEQQCIFLIHENDKRPIPCIVTKNNNADAIVSRADSIASYLDGINKCIGILFGECIEIFFQNTEDNKPTSIASIELDNSVLLGEVLCNLLEYNTFNYHKLVTFCIQQFKQVPNETNLLNRVQEVAADTDFISSKIKEVLLSEGYEESLISRVLSPLSFKIKMKLKEQQNVKIEHENNGAGGNVRG